MEEHQTPGDCDLSGDIKIIKIGHLFIFQAGVCAGSGIQDDMNRRCYLSQARELPLTARDEEHLLDKLIHLGKPYYYFGIKCSVY